MRRTGWGTDALASIRIGRDLDPLKFKVYLKLNFCQLTDARSREANNATASDAYGHVKLATNRPVPSVVQNLQKI